VVIASNYRQHRKPARTTTCCSIPRASVCFEGVTREVVAGELEGDERERHYARGI
jgi:hypothetical protein